MPEKASSRLAYGKTLVELGKEDQRIVVLDADLSQSTRTNLFAAAFPDRFFDCGVAEQNMIGLAAGLAAAGKISFASTFAVFATSRCFDQLRLAVAEPRLDVKVVATHAGITVGEDGFSHHAIEDLALTCSLPGFRVIAPADAIEAAGAVRLAAATPGPFYIRLPRLETPLVYERDYRFVLGKAVTLREGKDATIIATGIMVSKALEAAEALARRSVECRVVSMPTLKPLDEAAIVKAARETGAIVTVEEHLEHGGLGSRVAQAVVTNHPVPMCFVAIKDTFARSGKAEELIVRYGLAPANIEAAVLSVLPRK